jgi:phosphatidylserine decarboxylase
MTAVTKKRPPFRVGKWLPSDHALLRQWIGTHIKTVASEERPLHRAIREFKDVIEGDPELFMFFNQMFDELPRKPPFDKTSIGTKQIRDYHHLIELLNAIMTMAPEFDKTVMVGCPISVILDWSMGTTGGFAAFVNEKVNRHLKKVLNEWGTFLRSEDSRYVLSSDARKGWFGEDAKAAMPTFEEDFVCDPSQPHHGFRSWDDFFTRRFRDGVRPIASPDDDNVVVNACESAPYRVATDVKRSATFWIKAQPYSLVHMLANDERVDQFVGGTIYQAFLSALKYHRWHSPVSGTIVKTEVQDGTYYSESHEVGFDPAGPDESQSYITHMATRARIFIEADNPNIGLMCFMAVGMNEVSSCDVTVYEGQHVKKGDQLGMFHFGGSTHCLIFRPEVKLEMDLHGRTPGVDSDSIPINSRIATVKT